MLGYLVRRLMGGVLTFFLATFVMYTTILYMPKGQTNVNPQGRPLTERQVLALIENVTDTFELDRPWPDNFLAFLFDPGEMSEVGVFSGKTYPKGLQVSVLGIGIEGSGLLTGDFGRSLSVSIGDRVIDLYGPGLDLAFAFAISLTVTFMYVATVQRVGSSTPYIKRRQSANTGLQIVSSL